MRTRYFGTFILTVGDFPFIQPLFSQPFSTAIFHFQRVYILPHGAARVLKLNKYPIYLNNKILFYDFDGIDITDKGVQMFAVLVFCRPIPSCYSCQRKNSESVLSSHFFPVFMPIQIHRVPFAFARNMIAKE